ncbi:MAG: hypothetical protein RDU14_01010 [Melioribacteraceae bacterium]|nr:hypothetical protein [Melioribacteraceae bacterium]
MKLFEVLALLGALAWLPHLIKIIKDFFSMSEIEIIIQKSGEVGYTAFGSIFNIQMAFSVSNKDIIISGLKVKFTHESGESKVFSWQGIAQKFAELKRFEGESLSWEKEHSVLAIKLNEKIIEDRFVRFQDEEYILKKDELEAKLFKKLGYMRDDNNVDVELLIKSEEMKDLEAYIKHSLFWKQGNYKIEFLVESNHSFKIVNNIFEFTLTILDIDAFEKNKELIEKSYINVFKLTADSEYKFSKIFWNWRYPVIKKSS